MKKVFVGLSGGVDSGVSAALLQAEGYEVTGAFIKIWQPEFTECSWREDRLDAMRIAAALGIPFKEIDLSDEYKREVVESMIADYERGITPNPDVLCNRSIKFGHFARWARAEGAEAIATGHYARIGCQGDTLTLMRGKDSAKDQSYFLHTLTQRDLASTLFPVGGIEKREVREIAKKYRLPVAQKADSQGLCFVGDVSIPEFLSRYIPLKCGEVVDTDGNIVGTHDGAALYTIGQRHGFEKHGNAPLFVVAIDTARNTIIVSNQKSDAARREILVENIHWINQPNEKCEVQTRYRERSVRATVITHVDSTRVIFDEPHIVAPGQSTVFYRGSECLGGGVIQR